MVDLLLALFTNKHLFTGIIITLYALNTLFQVLVIKDYVWGGYWAGAFIITVFATQLSQRGVT